jgi:hypothetical protein
MTAETYIATAYGRGAVTKAHSTMREAFDWLTQQVDFDDRASGAVRLGGRVLVTFTRSETRWFHDGYERWRDGR